MRATLERAGFRTLAAATGNEALRIARQENPSVAIIEVSLPGVCGYRICRELRERLGDDVVIVFVSRTRTEPYDRVGGLLLGADDYLGKPFSHDELLARIAAHRRAPVVESELYSQLTPREQEVVRLLADGLSTEEIADQLSISVKTLVTHKSHIFAKLGVNTRAQLVALVHREVLANH